MTALPGAAELARRLDAAADQLTARVLAEMYDDPFWYERFGDRAERHGRADGRFHIDYLIQALHAGDPGIMETYARWLQRVLTSRGMATRHLAENFIRLAGAIRDQGWPHTEAAVALLDAAVAALHYDGAAGRLQDAAPAIAAAAARNQIDLDQLIGYAADAAALDQPAVFAAHVTWLACFLERRGTPRSELVDALTALLAVSEPAAATKTLHAIVQPALAAL